MVIIGLTGAIGSGKSTVTEQFGQLGAAVFDADAYARDLVKPGEPALKDIVSRFGDAILLPDGQLDRNRLRQRIFSDTNERQSLEAILHPRILSAMQADARKVSGHNYCIFSIPLLFEAGQHRAVERILVIDASDETRAIRVMQRDRLSEDDYAAINATQWPRDKRLSQADDVINNNESLDELTLQIKILHEKYQNLE